MTMLLPWHNTPWVFWMEALGRSLHHFVWQGTAVGILVALVLRLCSGTTASTRYWVALSGLLMMAAMPMATCTWYAFLLPAAVIAPDTANIWPQRIHWYPDDYVSDSRAVTKEFGEQPTIHLKTGPRLKGRLTVQSGQPVSEVTLMAVCGTRIPIRYSLTAADGTFEFPPLPPGEYTLRSVDSFVDPESGQHVNSARNVTFIEAACPLRAQPSEHDHQIVIDAVILRAQVVNGRQLPLTDREIRIEGLGINQRMTACPEPVGSYQAILPRGATSYRLTLTTTRAEAALYQQDHSAPVSRQLEFSVIDGDMTDIQIVVQRGATARVKLVDERGVPFTEPVNIQAAYLNDLFLRQHVYFNFSELMDGVVNRESGDPYEFSLPLPMTCERRSVAGDSYFELSGIIPVDPLRITVSANHHEPGVRDLQLQEGAIEDVEIVLKRSVSVGNVRVVGADGQDLSAHSRVTIWRLVDSVESGSLTWTDVHGRRWQRHASWSPSSPTQLSDYEWNLPQDTYIATATTYDEPTGDPTPVGASEGFVQQGHGQFTITLAGDCGLTLIAVDDETGKPVEKLALRLFAPTGQPIVHGGLGSNPEDFDQTDANGQLKYQHLRPGRYQVEVVGRPPARGGIIVRGPEAEILYPPQSRRANVSVISGRENVEEIRVTRLRFEAS